MKKSDFKPASDWTDALPADRRDRIEAGARQLLAKMNMTELRKAVKVAPNVSPDPTDRSSGRH